MPDARDRLIVALDVSSGSEARKTASAIADAASIFKVGKQLFTAEGPQVVRDLVASGRKVFLDLKFHDIPNTVAGAVRAASELGVAMLTVHASGGSKMLRAATDAAQGGSRPLVLAVTVLTSLTDSELQETGVSGRVIDQTLRLAALARSNGCGGVVCSAKETRELRRELGAGFAIVNPGIRPAGTETHDQNRVVTPQEAIAAGASHIVVGRPITGAADPSSAARSILDQIARAQALTPVA